MALRKDYFVTVRVIDLATEEPEQTHEVNFSTMRGRRFIEKLTFSCINTGKGVAIELDRTVDVDI